VNPIDIFCDEMFLRKPIPRNLQAVNGECKCHEAGGHNRRISEDIVLDMEGNDRIVGIEMMDASLHLPLEKLIPVKYEVPKEESFQG
jgi:uncharacterized protein YuzE